MLFAQDGGFWVEAGKQGSVAFVVIALGMCFIFGFFGFLFKFCQWATKEYFSPVWAKHVRLVDNCNSNLEKLVVQGDKASALFEGTPGTKDSPGTVGMAKCLEAIAVSNGKMMEKILEWPSDIPNKEEAKCKVGECELAVLSKEDFVKLYESIKQKKQIVI